MNLLVALDHRRPRGRDAFRLLSCCRVRHGHRGRRNCRRRPSAQLWRSLLGPGEAHRTAALPPASAFELPGWRRHRRLAALRGCASAAATALRPQPLSAHPVRLPRASRRRRSQTVDARNTSARLGDRRRRRHRPLGQRLGSRPHPGACGGGGNRRTCAVGVVVVVVVVRVRAAVHGAAAAGPAPHLPLRRPVRQRGLPRPRRPAELGERLVEHRELGVYPVLVEPLRRPLPACMSERASERAVARSVAV
eukprot:SAG22_NODE_11_length_35583_cov_107.128790_26_plen_250_part_00